MLLGSLKDPQALQDNKLKSTDVKNINLKKKQ